MLNNIIQDKSYDYLLTLCKPNRSPITYVPFEDLSFVRNFNNYNELSFTVCKYIYNQRTQTNEINPVWEQMYNNYVIKLEVLSEVEVLYEEYFYIQQSDINVSADNESKSIKCSSWHQLVFNKLFLRGFEDTRKLYDCKLSDDGVPTEIKWTVEGKETTYNPNEFTQGGVLNYILEHILNRYSSEEDKWKITYYDPELLKVGKPQDYVNTFTEDFLRYFFYDENIEYIINEDGKEVLSSGINYYWNTDINKCYNAILEDNRRLSYGDSDSTLNGSFTESLNLQNLLNTLTFDLDDFYATLHPTTTRGNKNFAEIVREPMYGTKILQHAENTLLDVQQYINVLQTAHFTDSITKQQYLKNAFDLYDEVLYKMITPLYIFNQCYGNMPFRSLTIDSNLGDTFTTLAEQFMCVFVFDNVSKEIKIYSRQNSMVDGIQSLILSPENYIQQMDKTEATDQIVTRLYVEGKDGVWFTSANPTGQRYVDNFSYFMTDKYMSTDLINALTIYNTEILPNATEQRIEFDYKDNGTMTSFTLTSLVDKINNLNEDYGIVETLYQQWVYANNEVMDTTGEARQAAYTEISNIKNQLRQYINFTSDSDIEAEKEELADKITRCENALVTFQTSLLYENVQYNNVNLFTPELLSELSNYILESDITIDTISDATALYNYGVDYLKYINSIPITFKLTLVDILSHYRYQLDWERITDVGQSIYIHFPDYNIDCNLFKIMSYTHQINSSGECSLSLELSNSYQLENVYHSVIVNVWANAYKSIQSIEKYKTVWEDYLSKQKDLLMSGVNISADVNNIVDSTGTTIINGSGIRVSEQSNNTLKKYKDGLYARDKVFVDDNDNYYCSDYVKIKNASYKAVVDSAGETTLEITTTGASVSNNGALSRYYTPPYYSTKLAVLSSKNVIGTFSEEDGGHYAYYQEIIGSTYTWYRAKINESAEDGSYSYEQYKDANGNALYWCVTMSGSGYSISARDMTYTSPQQLYPDISEADLEKAKVKIYTTETPQIIQRFDVQDGTHLPRMVLGLGDGAGYGKAELSKQENGMRYVYSSRIDNTNYGYAVAEPTETETKLYKVYNGIDFEDYVMKTYDTLEAAENDKTLPIGGIAIIKGM